MTQLYGLVNALWCSFLSSIILIYHPHLSAARFLILNMKLVCFLLTATFTVCIIFQLNSLGCGCASILVTMLLWSTKWDLHSEILNLKTWFTCKCKHKDNEKASPSGCSWKEAFFLPQKFSQVDKLLLLNDDQLNIVSEIKEFVGGDALLAFASSEFSEKAESVYKSLGVTELTIHDVWHILRPFFHYFRCKLSCSSFL